MHLLIDIDSQFSIIGLIRGPNQISLSMPALTRVCQVKLVNSIREFYMTQTCSKWGMDREDTITLNQIQTIWEEVEWVQIKKEPTINIIGLLTLNSILMLTLCRIAEPVIKYCASQSFLIIILVKQKVKCTNNSHHSKKSIPSNTNLMELSPFFKINMVHLWGRNQCLQKITIEVH